MSRRHIIVIFSLVILLAGTTLVSATSPNHLLILELCPDTYLRGEPDEYLAVYNPTGSDVDLSGYSLRDNYDEIVFPGGSVIHSGQMIYVAGNATAFYDQTRLSADYEYKVDSSSAVPQMTGKPLRLSNTGDYALLVDSSGGVVDAVVYGNAAYTGAGWVGSAVDKPSEGLILERNGIVDTDTQGDWVHLRERYLGQSNFQTQIFSIQGGATLLISPDNSYQHIASAIDNATESLLIEVYELDQPMLVDHIIDAVDRGVQVKVLLEGSPAGGLNDDNKNIIQMLLNAGADVRLTTGSGSSRIYRFMHAKYAVIDNESLILGSENWKDTGIPSDNTYGNRGWCVIIRDLDVAGYYTEVFDHDWTCKDATTPTVSGAVAKTTSYGTPHGDYKPQFKALNIETNLVAIPVIAPDNSLGNTILGMINNATETVYVQQLYIDYQWDDKLNPYLDALVNAARRGCEVKILLDSSWYNVEPDDPNDNDDTIKYVHGIAKSENINIQAKLIDTDGLSKLHNKGMIVDGNQTLISSVNWNWNSPVRNREAGIIIRNEEAAQYYTLVFMYDWGMRPDATVSEVQEQDMMPTPVYAALIIVMAVILAFGYSMMRKR